MKNYSPRLSLALALFAGVAIPFAGFAQGTAFTYQGRLTDGANPANGSYDLRFILYDNSAGGNQQGPILTNTATTISNGLFAVTLDFGNQFPGANRWLEIAVRTNGAVSFITLSSRQSLTPAPYAVTAENVVSGGLSGTYGSAVTFNNAANTFGGTFTGNGSGLTNVNAATLNGLTSSNFWKTTGNGGTTPGVNFLGTADNQPLELRVNSARALRLEPNAVGAPNVIAGSPVNFTSNNVVGATISGGGSVLYTNGSSYTNIVMADFGTIGGGGMNVAGNFATVGGGYFNTANNIYATVGGGNVDNATGYGSTAAGGVANNATGDSSFIGGGYFNFASSYAASVAGGYQNNASGYYSTIGGGYDNQAAGGFFSATVAGGFINHASGDASAVGGGYGNTASGVGAVVSGGGYDGGTASGNLASGNASVVGGGLGNQATNSYATVGGGQGNIAGGMRSTVSGGLQNIASGTASTVSGGHGNNASGTDSTVVGGDNNLASGFSSLAAGTGAQAVHSGAFVWADSVGGTYSSDRNNQFKVRAAGGMVLDVSSSAGLSPAAFRVSSTAAHGVGIFVAQTSDDATAVFTAAGTGDIIKGFNGGNGGNAIFEVFNNGVVAATSFNSTSDRNAKENFSSVSAEEILDRVVALPVTRWNYKTDAGEDHLGPMAQDFHAAFGLNGTDDKHISLLDEGGVALAAIQGLNQKLENRSGHLEDRERQLEAENAELKQTVADLKQLVTALDHKLNQDPK
jgi:trimeric autotransporter adhesin